MSLVRKATCAMPTTSSGGEVAWSLPPRGWKPVVVASAAARSAQRVTLRPRGSSGPCVACVEASTENRPRSGDRPQLAVLPQRAAVRRERRDHVAYPAEQPPAANPQPRRDDQPEDAAKEVP